MNTALKNIPKLAGKVAIVTASTEGIGFAAAKRLAEDGASVIISSRKQANVQRAVKELKSYGLDVCGTVCHVGKPEDRKKLVEFTISNKCGIDIFVSNAAVNPAVCNLQETSEEAWDKIFDVNLKSAFLLSKEIIPHMQKRGGGSIVFVSTAGAYQPSSMAAAYCISKTALLGLTRVLALECVPMNIRVNCMCPGLIETNFARQFTSNIEVLKKVDTMIPMKRIGQPSECAGLVSFLCSNDASYLTGESIVVAGGCFSRL